MHKARQIDLQIFNLWAGRILPTVTDKHTPNTHSSTHTHTCMHTVWETRARQSTNQILSRYFLWNFNNFHMHRAGTTHTYLTHIHTHTHLYSSWSTTWLRHVANMTWYCRMLFLLMLLLILLYATPAPPPLCCCLRLHSATRNTLTHIHTHRHTHREQQ